MARVLASSVGLAFVLAGCSAVGSQSTPIQSGNLTPHLNRTAVNESAVKPSYVQSGGYVYWSPPSSAPAAYDDYQWEMVIDALPSNTADYWYSIQDDFAGTTSSPPEGFDMGYQTYTPDPVAIFNFNGSINHVISAAQNCEIQSNSTACGIAYVFTIGKKYRFQAKETVNKKKNTETWTGTVTDVAANQKTTIGSWTITGTEGGLLAADGISFVYDLGTPPNCAQEPYQKVTMFFPVGLNGKNSYTSSVGSTSKAKDCAFHTDFTRQSSDIIVETGPTPSPPPALR